MDNQESGKKNTKYIIADAFIDLLNQKDIDRITVKDITSACHISRQTFYYHYQDMYGVFEFQLQRSFDDLERHCIALDDPRKALRLIVKTGYENRKLIVKIQGMKTSQTMNQYATDVIDASMHHIVEKCLPEHLDLKKADLDIMVEFYSNGLYYYLIKKLSTGKYNIDQITEQLYRILTGMLIPLK